MNSQQKIIEEIQDIPEALLNEVLDFIQFLKQKHLTQNQLELTEINPLETVLLSESSLQKDWLKPEEDKAWQHL
jgi:succinyl-CoA synthetase beta subunit